MWVSFSKLIFLLFNSSRTRFVSFLKQNAILNHMLTHLILAVRIVICLSIGLTCVRSIHTVINIFTSHLCDISPSTTKCSIFYYRTYLSYIPTKHVERTRHLSLHVSIWFRLIKFTNIDTIMISITNITMYKVTESFSFWTIVNSFTGA